MGTTKKSVCVYVYICIYIYNIKSYFEMVNPISQNVVLDDKCYKHVTQSAELPHSPSVVSDLISCFWKVQGLWQTGHHLLLPC